MILRLLIRFFCFIICVFSASFVCAATEGMPVLIDAELPFRCAAPAFEKSLASTLVLKDTDFVFLSAETADPLPRYAVNGYTFKNKPLDKALSELVKDAGITVIAEPATYPTMSATNITGELAGVVQQLADKANIFYTYYANSKTLILKTRTTMAIQLPYEKSVLLALLDALRGAEIKRLNVDWEKYQIRMDVSVDELTRAKALVQQIMHDSYLLVAETKMYYVESLPNGTHLNNSIGSLGLDKLATITSGVVGQSIVLNNTTPVDELIQRIKNTTKVSLLAQGVAIVPNGWNMRFNLGECAVSPLPYPHFSMLVRTRIHNQNDMQTQITLLSSAGELASFPLTTALNQEVALVGIPAGNQQGEFVFAIRLNLIRFTKRGGK